MRIPAVRNGDTTTTGGKVIALDAGLFDNGTRLVLDGEHATCGNCEGGWPIVGTGYRIGYQGRPVAIDDDEVRCPCGKRRLIAGKDAKYFIHKDGGDSEVVTTASSTRTPPWPATYDEQFTLLDEARRPLSNVRYRIVVDGRRVIAGTTNAKRQTERVATDTASKLRLYTTGVIRDE